MKVKNDVRCFKKETIKAADLIESESASKMKKETYSC